MSTWTCTVCDVTIKLSSRHRHLETQRHKSKLVPCNICCKIATTNRSCRSCNQKWCWRCDRDITTCPYCRADLPGKQLRELRNLRPEERLIALYEIAIRRGLNMTLDEWIMNE